MAKAASPIRIQDELMQQAILTGKRQHRSAAEQIEYWADIGRQVSAHIDPDTLLAVSMGLAELNVDPVSTTPIQPQTVFQALEESRDAGTLATEVTNCHVRYQASQTHPGYLEQIDRDGRVTVGQFSHGRFIPLKD